MKNQIRSQYKLKRSLMTKEECSLKSKKACEVFLLSEIYKQSKVIMLYMPLGNETDTSDIIKTAFADGKRVVFPVTDSISGIITPYYAEPDTEFAKGAFSVSEPTGASVAKKSDIDVVLVPGIAFDINGARVGFGKGCYDMFLKNVTAIKVGYCYDFQLCDEIPSDEHDIMMDYVVTENGIKNI